MTRDAAPSLVRNSGIYATAQLVQSLLAALLIPVWAHSLLPEDYAITGTLTAYSGVLGQIILFGLHSAAGKHVIDLAERRDHQASYVTSVIAVQAVTAFLIVGSLDLVRGLVPLPGVGGSPLIEIVLWTTFLTSLAATPLSILQHLHRAEWYATSQLATYLVGMGATFLLVVVWQQHAAGVLRAQLIAALLGAVVLLALMVREWRFGRLEGAHVSAAFRYGLPLVPYALAGTLAVAVDRFVLDRNVGLAELGGYNFAVTLSSPFRVVLAAITQAWVPHYLAFMRDRADRDERTERMISRYVAGAGFICLVGILFVKPVVQLLLPDRFMRATVFVPALLLGHILNGLVQFAMQPLAYFDKTALMPLLAGAAALVSIGADVYFIPRYGALGAAWIVVGSGLVALGLAFVVGRRYQRAPLPLLRYAAALVLLVGTASAPLVLGELPLWSSVLVLALYAAVTGLPLLRAAPPRAPEAPAELGPPPLPDAASEGSDR